MSENSISSEDRENFPICMYQQIPEKDLHIYVKKAGWPVGDYFPNPFLLEGSDKPDITKGISVYLSEKLRLSLDRHFEAIGILGKYRQAWFKHAILGLLEEEQLFDKDPSMDSKDSNLPLKKAFLLPSLVEGDEKINYKTHIAVYLSERVRISLQEHLKGRGLSRRKWIEKALLRLLRKEQEYFFYKEHTARI